MIVIESLHHTGLTVANIEKSISFYKDLFDFEVIEKLSGTGQAFLKIGDILLGLYESEGYKAKDNKSRIAFYVDEEDFDDAVEELEESGIKIVYGPENLRGGQSVVFLDPDGNQIELAYPSIG